MNYLFVPGAWMGGWVWEEVASRLAEKGHTANKITLSGLHSDQADTGVSLETHVEDIFDYLQTNGLNRVVLVGHSYSGFVLGQVAVRAPELVRHTVFIEAFLPVDGKSLLEVSGLDVEYERDLIEKHSGLWPAPTKSELRGQSHLNASQVALLASRIVGHPGRTVTDPARLPKPLSEIHATFIASKGWISGYRESALLECLRLEETWTFKYIEGGHWPMLTMPDQLSDLLDTIMVPR